jgi:cellulose synthase/poly-beta-1,6-N-acetylglucosamine synthase-like glycosyltransferase
MSDKQVSVVVVSDYEPSDIKSWETEESILKALAAQTYTAPFEILLVENDQYRNKIPNHFYDLVPNLKIIFSTETQSAKLKDFGVSLTSGELIAVFEADAPPNEDWLRLLVDILQEHPEVSVVSGRTSYGTDNTYMRVANLMDRSFDDLGKPSYSPFVSNNGALYRRSVLEEFPYPDAITPFLSSRLRTNLMKKSGHKFYFEPRAITYHQIGGWSFITDVRRNLGYSDMHMFDRQMSYLSIPQVIMWRLDKQLSYCRRLGRQYLCWYDWPFALLMLLIIPFFEIPGMIDAVQQKEGIPQTAYR